MTGASSATGGENFTLNYDENGNMTKLSTLRPQTIRDSYLLRKQKGLANKIDYRLTIIDYFAMNCEPRTTNIELSNLMSNRFCGLQENSCFVVGVYEAKFDPQSLF